MELDPPLIYLVMNIFFHRSFCELRKPVARVYILYLNLFGLATTAPLSPTIAPLSVIFEPVIFELGIIKHSRLLSYVICCICVKYDNREQERSHKHIIILLEPCNKIITLVQRE